MKKKFLIVSGLQVFPPESGGQLRTSTLAKTLVSLGHEVVIFSLTGRKSDYLKGRTSAFETDLPQLKEYVFRGKFFGLLQFLSYRLGLAPFWVIWLAPLFKPRELVSQMAKADQIILDFPYLFKLAGSPYLLNTHNAEFELYPKDSWQSKLIKRYEHRALTMASQVLFCHQGDLEKFQELGSALVEKSFIVPNGVELKDFVFNPHTRQSVREKLGLNDKHTVFLFTGSQYAPNREAFEYLKQFSEQYKNELEEHHLVILVAGTVSRDLIDRPSFKVLGRVEVMADYFWASDFGLNPVEEGSGTNVKMIEFLAAKLPTLSCAFGARGLEMNDLVEGLIFERNTLFEKMVIASKMSLEQRKTMAQEALEKNRSRIEMKEALKLVLCGKLS